MDDPRTQFRTAFDQTTKALIDAVPNDVGDDATYKVIRGICDEIGVDAEKLYITMRIIIDRAIEDTNIDWTSTGAKLLTGLMDCTSSLIQSEDGVNRHGVMVTGEKLARKYVLDYCQTYFEHEVEAEAEEWNPMFFRLQAELTNIPYSPWHASTALLVMVATLSEAEQLFSNNNFIIYLDFVHRIGPKIEIGTTPTKTTSLSSILNTLQGRVME